MAIRRSQGSPAIRTTPARRTAARFAAALGVVALLGALLPAPILLAAGTTTPTPVNAVRLSDLAPALAADGTFHGAPGVAGTVDSKAWTLVSDPTKGEPPRFAPAAAAATIPGPWSAFGSDGAGNGAINGWVYAIAVSGTTSTWAATSPTPAAMRAPTTSRSGMASLVRAGRCPTRSTAMSTPSPSPGPTLYVGWSLHRRGAASRPPTTSPSGTAAPGPPWAPTAPVTARSTAGSTRPRGLGQQPLRGRRLHRRRGIATADHVAKWNGSAWSAWARSGAGDGPSRPRRTCPL